MRAKHQGFTLMEVLIASFIMFISLTIFSSVFSSALLSSQKAESNISTAAYTDLIVGEISSSIKSAHQQSEISGQGDLLNRKFVWHAKVKESTRPPARYFGQALAQAEHQAKLWHVQLTISFNGKESSYSFEEVSW